MDTVVNNMSDTNEHTVPHSDSTDRIQHNDDNNKNNNTTINRSKSSTQHYTNGVRGRPTIIHAHHHHRKKHKLVDDIDNTSQITDTTNNSSIQHNNNLHINDTNSDHTDSTLLNPPLPSTDTPHSSQPTNQFIYQAPPSNTIHIDSNILYNMMLQQHNTVQSMIHMMHKFLQAHEPTYEWNIQHNDNNNQHDDHNTDYHQSHNHTLHSQTTNNNNNPTDDHHIDTTSLYQSATIPPLTNILDYQSNHTNNALSSTSLFNDMHQQ